LGLGGAEVAGRNDVEDVDVMPLAAQSLDIGGIALSGFVQQFLDWPAGLLMLVFDMNADVHLTKNKDEVSIGKGVGDFAYFLIVPGQVVGRSSVQLVAPEQHGRIRNIGMVFKAT